MLNTSSSSPLSRAYRNVSFVFIVASVTLHLFGTVEWIVAAHGGTLHAVEAALSAAFAGDYACRLFACHERRRYAHLGPIAARLRWQVSWEALLDAASFVPFFVDEWLLAGDRLPSLGWVRVFRIFLIFRTARWAGAVRCVGRVLFVNREILTTSLALVSLTILLTSTLLHAACATDECGRAHGTASLPSAMYVATMMLTGQASPEGELSAVMRAVVLLTAFLSVPFFAVPAAMLTWGFEGEAQRLATRERERRKRRDLYSLAGADEVQSSDSSTDDDLEDFVEEIGGGGSDEEERAAAGERALAFFNAGAQPAGRPHAHDIASLAAAAAEPQFLFRAYALAARLRDDARTSARRRQRQRDALELLEKLSVEFDEGLSAEQALRIESRLAAFAKAAALDAASAAAPAPADGSTGGGADEPQPGLEALRSEVAALRRSTVAALSELNASVAEIGRRLKS